MIENSSWKNTGRCTVFAVEPDGKTVLRVGAERRPFAVPLVSHDGKWYFDRDSGAEETKQRLLQFVTSLLCKPSRIVCKHELTGENDGG